MKRGYFVHNNDEDQGGIVVVANTAHEARKIVYRSGEIIYGDTGWIHIRSKWVRSANVDDLPIGIISDERDALLRGFYAWISSFPCDKCGKESDVHECNGRVLCMDCARVVEQ